MPKTSHIHVRRLEIADFRFVQDLASRQPTFTVPPIYVLWLMLRIKGSICLIAEDSTKGPVAYLISVPIESPVRSIFVWQLAASQGMVGAQATFALLEEFRSVIERLAITEIVFSSVPDSSAYRAIRRYALKVFSSSPQSMNALPSLVDTQEFEFLLNFKRRGTSRVRMK